MSDLNTSALATADAAASRAAPRFGGRFSGLHAIAPMIAAVVLLCAGNSLLSTVVGLTLVHGGIDKIFVPQIVTGYPAPLPHPPIVWLWNLIGSCYDFEGAFR